MLSPPHLNRPAHGGWQQQVRERERERQRERERGRERERERERERDLPPHLYVIVRCSLQTLQHKRDLLGPELGLLLVPVPEDQPYQLRVGLGHTLLQHCRRESGRRRRRRERGREGERDTCPVVPVEGEGVGAAPQEDVGTANLAQSHRQVQRSATSRVQLLAFTLRHQWPAVKSTAESSLGCLPLRLSAPLPARRLSPPRPASGAASVP